MGARMSAARRKALPAEAEAIAAALESRCGVHAAAVAEFFEAYHGRCGNLDRSVAWARVAQKVKHRQRVRMADPA